MNNEKLLLKRSLKKLNQKRNIAIGFIFLGLTIYLFSYSYPDHSMLQKLDYGLPYVGVGVLLFFFYMFDRNKPYLIVTENYIKKNTLLFPQKINVSEIDEVKYDSNGVTLFSRKKTIVILKSTLDKTDYDIFMKCLPKQ